MREFLAFAIIVFISGVAAGYWLTGMSPSIDETSVPMELAATGAIPADAVTVKFLGNTNLLIRDSETAILTDGYFTRPSTRDVLFGLIEPDRDAIDAAVARAGINHLAAVIPVHSHFDHAMDSPEVAMRTGALLVGSESTANIGRGWDMPEDRIRVVEPGDPMTFGKFTVTLIESWHYVFPGRTQTQFLKESPVIEEPLVPPVKMAEYAEGGAFSILIEHPKGSILVQGSAGYVPGALDGVKVDVLFLGVGGLAGQTPEYHRAYWEEVAEAAQPAVIYPVHWDSLVDPLSEEPVMPNNLWSRVGGFYPMKSVEVIHAFAAEMPEARLALLPMWEPVILFE